MSLGGRGDLRDWELMNRPGKGFVPVFAGAAPFFAMYAQRGTEPAVCRVLEGPVDADQYEGSPVPRRMTANVSAGATTGANRAETFTRPLCRRGGARQGAVL